MVKARRTIRSNTLRSALRNFIIPSIAAKYNVFALRCLWDVTDNDRHIYLCLLRSYFVYVYDIAYFVIPV